MAFTYEIIGADNRAHGPEDAAAVCRWIRAGLMLSVAAVICGHLAWGAIRAEPELLGGKGMVVARLITGYLGIVVGALSLLGAVVMAVSIYLGFR